jgi:hypothetical protein
LHGRSSLIAHVIGRLDRAAAGLSVLAEIGRR